MARTEEQRIKDERDDLSFLNRPGMWPNWPMCPVKSHAEKHKDSPTDFIATGIVFDTAPIGDQKYPNGKAQPEVVMLNMFGGWTPEQFKAAKRFKYDSIEELVADGWEVD